MEAELIHSLIHPNFKELGAMPACRTMYCSMSGTVLCLFITALGGLYWSVVDRQEAILFKVCNCSF